MVSFRGGDNIYVPETYEMMTLFQSSKELVKYCKNNIFLEKTRKENILYRNTRFTFRIKMKFILKCVMEADENMVSVLGKKIPTLYDEGIYIWGAGQYGTLIADYLKIKGIKVHAIIDNAEEKIGNLIGETPVVSFCGLDKENLNILLGIASKNAVNSVIEQINAADLNAKIITLEEIFDFIGV